MLRPSPRQDVERRRLVIQRLDYGTLHAPVPVESAIPDSFVLERRSLVNVELDGLEADAVEARDGEGRPVVVVHRFGWEVRKGTSVPVVDGNLSELLVPLTARSIAVLRGGEVIRERSIAPRPGAYVENNVTLRID